MSDSLDHIIWACGDLESGSRQFETLTGVKPRYGGMHASGSTHNALVSIGPRCYLEILAPTGPQKPGEDAWCRLARTVQEPRILTYCVRSTRPLSELTGTAEGLGAHRAEVSSNGRTTPEGVRLNWKWLAPTIDRFGLAFPFFIDWLDSPHPALSLPETQHGGEIRLAKFAVGHPDAVGLRETLVQLGASIDTYTATDIEFRSQLHTPLGVISL